MISVFSAIMEGQETHVMTKVAVGLIWSSFQMIMGRLEQFEDGGLMLLIVYSGR